MTAGDLAVVVATVLCTLGFAGLVVALLYVFKAPRLRQPSRTVGDGSTPRRLRNPSGRRGDLHRFDECSVPRRRSSSVEAHQVARRPLAPSSRPGIASL